LGTRIFHCASVYCQGKEFKRAQGEKFLKIWFDQKTKVFVCEGHFATDTDRIKRAGFVHNPLLERYETAHLRVAAHLKEYFDTECLKIISRVSCEILSPWVSGILIPKNQQLDKYQRLGVLHAMERNHSYLAFEQGMGKTPTAIAIMNTYGKNTVILLPPHLIPNWQREIEKWETSPNSWGAVDGKLAQKESLKRVDVVFVPDTLIGSSLVSDFVRSLGSSHPLLIVEEAQRFVNCGAQRTQALCGDTTKLNPDGLLHQFEKVVFLSGTPMPNRPIELFPILKSAAANVINHRSKEEYGVRYCAAYDNGFGLDYKGSSNLEELSKRMHGLFMRREEKGSDFVNKSSQVVYIKNTGYRIKALEKVILNKRPMSDFFERFQDGLMTNQELGDIAKFRQTLGEAKIKFCANYVKEILDTTKASILILAWHKRVIENMAYVLHKYCPAVVTGEVNINKREARIENFQRGGTRILVMNIQTAVGYNLDKATRALFLETSWSPKDNSQAQDRIHRRTSKEPVLIEYLALDESLDDYVINTNLKKLQSINTLINKRSL
jgi:SWI/SNF-related matrix-associated actin-dependent regulator 1 of chromatin subfamily A